MEWDTRPARSWDCLPYSPVDCAAPDLALAAIRLFEVVGTEQISKYLAISDDFVGGELDEGKKGTWVKKTCEQRRCAAKGGEEAGQAGSSTRREDS